MVSEIAVESTNYSNPKAFKVIIGLLCTDVFGKTTKACKQGGTNRLAALLRFKICFVTSDGIWTSAHKLVFIPFGPPWLNVGNTGTGIGI